MLWSHFDLPHGFISILKSSPKLLVIFKTNLSEEHGHVHHVTDAFLLKLIINKVWNIYRLLTVCRREMLKVAAREKVEGKLCINVLVSSVLQRQTKLALIFFHFKISFEVISFESTISLLSGVADFARFQPLSLG